MYIREYRKDGIIRVVASCDFCGVETDRSKSNHNTSTKKHNGKSYCRSCGKRSEVTGKPKYKNTPIHNSYAAAKQRCNYKEHSAYDRYGGRGIKFEWKSFEDFIEDMKDSWFEGATLERIDLDGNYCKENCKWATMKEQARNTSRNIHNEERVLIIREMYKSGYKQTELANIFNDSQGNISNIVKGRTWSM